MVSYSQLRHCLCHWWLMHTYDPRFTAIMSEERKSPIAFVHNPEPEYHDFALSVILATPKLLDACRTLSALKLTEKTVELKKGDKKWQMLEAALRAAHEAVRAATQVPVVHNLEPLPKEMSDSTRSD